MIYFLITSSYKQPEHLLFISINHVYNIIDRVGCVISKIRLSQIFYNVNTN